MRLSGMQIHPDSHIDHWLSAAQMAHILSRFSSRDGFFIETIELPEGLGTVPCALYGPAMGDPPIGQPDVVVLARGDRTWSSRCVVRPLRQVRSLTVIAGPHGDFPCVLFTAYGGPLAPQEVGELEQRWEFAAAERPRTAASVQRMDDAKAKLREARPFWAEHALAVQ